MTDLFIDTDVIIDFLVDRKPFSREAAIIFTLIEQKKLRGYASSLTFSNLYYVLRKFESHNKVISKLDSLSNMLNILKVEEQTIKKALASGFTDFEDSIQYFSAIENRKIEINARQKQSIFRTRVLNNFEHRCCLSDTVEENLLIASHRGVEDALAGDHGVGAEREAAMHGTIFEGEDCGFGRGH